MNGVNDSGAVVGTAWTLVGRSTTVSGFLYSQATYTLLSPPGWTGTEAVAINNQGVVAGNGLSPSGRGCFIYTAGAYSDVTPAGLTDPIIYDINENGYVVGAGIAPDGTMRGFVLSNGAYTELLPPGWKSAVAWGMNDRGAVVGSGTDANDSTRGFTYDTGTYAELQPADWLTSVSQDLNNDGMIAGTGDKGVPGSPLERAYIYSQGTYTLLLPTSWVDSYAVGINDEGTVVGWGNVADGERGFSYSRGIFTEMLPDGWTYSRTTRISSNGTVAGYGMAGGVTMGFIAVPMVNRVPLASAGPDQTVHAGRLVSLDGSGSSDPDGDQPLSYSWSIVLKPAGSTSVLAEPTAVSTGFAPDTPGDYEVQLVVTDNLGAASAPVKVRISATNTAPQAVAGRDQYVKRGYSLVNLDGSQSYDLDGDAIAYQWSFVSMPARSRARLDNARTAHPTFVADAHGTYVLMLVTSDPWSQSSADTVNVVHQEHEAESASESEWE